MLRELRCKKRKAAVIILTLFFILPALLFAQNDPSIETDWDDYIHDYDLYSFGDQTFMISLGMVFPLAFINNGKVVDNKIDPPIGGTGSISYNYFISSKLFVGFELAGMFLPTIGDKVVYIIPLGAKFGIQFIAGRFEFPVSASLGMVWHKFLDDGYYGLYMKIGGSAFFRATNNWAFGVTTNFYWFPQWIRKDKSKNVDGLFFDFNLSARFHF